MKRIDLVGQRFGDWLVLRYASDSRWRCRCVCGRVRDIDSHTLRKGLSTSCGCTYFARITIPGTHASDGRRTPEYVAWDHMIRRCENPKTRLFHRYGGRGISVCARWRNSFTLFLSDVGARPSAQHSIDRFPNRDGNYEPGNVRWATREEQNNNTCKTRLVTIDGVSRSLAQWARYLGVSDQAIYDRLRSGWPEREALTTPKFGRKKKFGVENAVIVGAISKEDAAKFYGKGAAT